MGSSCSKPQGPIQITDDVARVGFPHTIHLTWMKSLSKAVIHMAVSGLPPLSSIGMPEGYGGHTILYVEPSIETSPMAYITRSGSEFMSNLPGILGSGIMPCRVSMVCEHRNTEVRYRFMIMVRHGTNYRSESFEWCRSGGNEAKSLGSPSPGWKLVRLGPNPGVQFPPRISNAATTTPCQRSTITAIPNKTPAVTPKSRDMASLVTEKKSWPSLPRPNRSCFR
jgi:hypothetical protein